MGHAFQSPLRRWEVLAGLAEQMKARTFVEVGCKAGGTTAYLLDHFPEMRAIAIDPWAPMPNEAEDYSDHDFAEIEKTFWKNIGANKNRCRMLRMTSLEAAANSVDGGTEIESRMWIYPHDIVFLDAGHDLENCLADINAWWPHVREGGYLCGHDYQQKFPGVMRAVAQSFPLLRVAVCPDSVWVVQKEADMPFRRAA